MNLGVGIIGDSDDPANLMYVAVIAIGVVGAMAARLRPRAMARALFATAFAMAIVPAIALATGMHLDGRTPPVGTFVSLHVLLAGLFTGSALLFRRAAQGRPPAVQHDEPYGEDQI